MSTDPVGLATLTFLMCSTATLDYVFTDGEFAGEVDSIDLVRLGPALASWPLAKVTFVFRNTAMKGSNPLPFIEIAAVSGADAAVVYSSNPSPKIVSTDRQRLNSDVLYGPGESMVAVTLTLPFAES